MPYFFLTVILCILDQIVKWIIQSKMSPFQSIGLLDERLSLSYVQNYGAAFGILESQTVFLIIIAGAVFLFAWLNRRTIRQQSKLFQLGLAIALGGALGNFIDRIRFGYVVDFIDFHFWPVFNIADINIVTGVILLIIGLSVENMRRKRQGPYKINNQDHQLFEEEQG